MSVVLKGNLRNSNCQAISHYDTIEMSARRNRTRPPCCYDLVITVLHPRQHTYMSTSQIAQRDTILSIRRSDERTPRNETEKMRKKQHTPFISRAIYQILIHNLDH